MSDHLKDILKKLNRIKFKSNNGNSINQDYQKMTQCFVDYVNQLDTQINTIENSMDTIVKRKIFTIDSSNNSTLDEFVVPDGVTTLYVTMIGGGGAGGIGHVLDSYYYSGAGGGSGAFYDKIIINVFPGDVIDVSVGRGGSAKDNRNGEDTYIELEDGEIYTAKGGINGHPNTLSDITVTGGAGVESELHPKFDGLEGQDGNISLPSQITLQGGKGANSPFSKGGVGEDTNNDIDYTDGNFGSGGGGSVARNIVDLDVKVSGDGGDGFVIIDW